MRSTEYAGVWREARAKALSAEDAVSLLAEVPYSLRYAGVSLWIKAGVDPVEVARRAGHSIAVLWKIYAKVLDGRRDQANALIELAMRAAAQDNEAARSPSTPRPHKLVSDGTPAIRSETP